MIAFLLNVLIETWSVLEEAAIFLLAGFMLAGLLIELVPADLLRSKLGRGRVRSVLWASAVGAPLPLCSCGVLPAALALRRQGATDGATVGFLVATPETGIDSLALSYSLADPLFTVARPIAGVATAIAAGIATNLASPARPRDTAKAAAYPAAASAGADTADLCGHAHPHTDDECHHSHHHHGTSEPHDRGGAGATASGFVERGAGIARRVLQAGFDDLLDDISYWLVVGLLLSGLILAAMPDDFIGTVLGGGIWSMLAMALVAIPVYTCAASSTPIAAALVLKGLSPGAALVFLLTGPATNLSSLVVLLRVLGTRTVLIYLGVAIAMAIGAGLLLDLIYRAWAITPAFSFGAGGDLVPQWIKPIAALILLALLARSLWRTQVPAEWQWVGARLAALTGLRPTARRAALALATAALALYVTSGIFVVGPGQMGLVFRFGAPTGSGLAPGLHARLPWPIDTHMLISRAEIRRLVFGVDSGAPSATAARRAPRLSESFGTPPPPASGGVLFRKDNTNDTTLLLTGDSNVIDIRFALHWRIADPLLFYTDVDDAATLLTSLALSALRASVARTGIDSIYTTARTMVARQVVESMQAALDRYGAGIAVLEMHILYDHPPDEVHDAFRDVASAQEDKLRTVNRAEMFAIEKTNHSLGDAAAMLEEAKGFRDAQILRATGETDAFRTRLAAYRSAPDLTKFRLRMETAEAAFAGAAKLIAPAPHGAPVDLWLNQLGPPAGPR